MLNAFAELIRQYLAHQMAQLDVFGLVCAVMIFALECFAVKVIVMAILEGRRIDAIDIVNWFTIGWCGTATAALWLTSWILR